VVRRQNADIANTLQLRDVAMATTFWLSMGYNFGCMIARHMLFDSSCGFSRSSYPMKATDFEVLRDVGHENHFLLSIYEVHIGATW